MFFGWFDAIFSFIFPILFLLFIGMFFFALISNLRTWNKNNHSPRLTVPATVVAKRTDVSHSSSANAGDMSGAHGYDTSTFTSYYVTFQVESGDQLSTGEKQLISFARAVLADPRIFVLDEATASIDTKTEELIQHAISTLLENRTSFLIAHRLSTIRHADLILVVRAGKIIEQGTHEELLQNKGYYADLYNKQFEQENVKHVFGE